MAVSLFAMALGCKGGQGKQGLGSGGNLAGRVEAAPIVPEGAALAHQPEIWKFEKLFPRFTL